MQAPLAVRSRQSSGLSPVQQLPKLRYKACVPALSRKMLATGDSVFLTLATVANCVAVAYGFN